MTETLTIIKPKRRSDQTPNLPNQGLNTQQMEKNRLRKESVSQEQEADNRSDCSSILKTTIRELTASEYELMLESVLAAFPKTRDWRNTWGLSQATGYSEEQVQRVLEHYQDHFETAPFEIAESKFYRPRVLK